MRTASPPTWSGRNSFTARPGPWTAFPIRSFTAMQRRLQLRPMTRWRTNGRPGNSLNLVRDKGYYQAAFHSRLAERLAALGYGIERDGNSFRLAGIDPATAEKFSRRTEIIERRPNGSASPMPKAKGELGADARKKDAEGMSVPELRKAWKARLSDGERDAINGARRGQESTSPWMRQGMDYALSHCFERAIGRPGKGTAQNRADSQRRQCKRATMCTANYPAQHPARNKGRDMRYATTRKCCRKSWR
jgi:hypothetical protein